MSFNYVAREVGEEFGYDVAVNNEGDAFYVTPCCGASSKGMEDYTGCRRCYQEVDPGLGGIPTTDWYAPHRRAQVDDTKNFLRDVMLRSLGIMS
jgi:hypothetical protein